MLIICCMCVYYTFLPGFIRASENVRDPGFLDVCPRNGLFCPRFGLSCPRNGKFCCLRFGKFEKDVFCLRMCSQTERPQRTAVNPLTAVFHPRPRVRCLASSHLNSRGEGVPLLSFYRSPKIECRHPCDRMAVALQWTLQNK